MTTPVTKGGNPSIVARNPINVPCNPAPSMSMPMPSSSGQVENTCRAGNAMPAVYRRTSIDLLTDAWSHVALRSTRAGCQRNAFVTLTNSSRTLLWLSTVSLAEAPSSLRGRGNDHVHNDAAKKSRKTRIHRHPDVGRDPDTRAARHARAASPPAYAGGTRTRSVRVDLATVNIPRRPGARPGSRHKTGAPGARSLDSGLRRSDENEVRCLGCGDAQHSPSSRRQAGIQTQERRATAREAYRGRGAVSLLPALRTVRAVLPHTALRSVVIYIEIGAQERELAIG